LPVRYNGEFYWVLTLYNAVTTIEQLFTIKVNSFEASEGIVEITTTSIANFDNPLVFTTGTTPTFAPSARLLTNTSTSTYTDLLESDFLISCAEIQLEGAVLVWGGSSAGGGGYT